MTAIYALYSNPDAAQRAVDSLEACDSITSRDITVLTSDPYEEYRFGHRDSRTWMPWLAPLGGLIGGFSGYSLAVFTQNAYPLPTGGMPLSPFPTNGIITYELTMLGAILTTLVTLLIAAGLPSRVSSKLYDPEVSDGKILVGVANPPPESCRELEKRLRDAGADRVVTPS